MVSFNGLHQSARRLKKFDGFGSCIQHRHALQRSCHLGHGAVKVNRLEGREAEFSEHRDVVLVAKGTHHEHTGAEIGFDRRVLLYLDRGGPPLRVQRETDLLPDEVLVAIVFRVNNNHATSTNQLGSCCGNDQFCTVFTGPSDVNQFRLSWESFNLCIGDGRTLHRVVDVGAEVLNDVAFLEQVNENGLGYASIVRRICQVFPRKITGKADSLGRASHGLRERFDGGLAKFEKFFTVVSLHLAFGVFLHGEFNVDAVSINTPREVHFFAQEALTAGEDVDHGVLGNSADVPCARRVGGRRVNDEEFLPAVRVEGVASAVRLFIGIVCFLDGFLKVNRPSFFGKFRGWHVPHLAPPRSMRWVQLCGCGTSFQPVGLDGNSTGFGSPRR